MTASSSNDRTVECGSLGPVGRSATDVRFFHNRRPLLPLGDRLGVDAIALGERPQALLTILYCSTDRLCPPGRLGSPEGRLVTFPCRTCPIVPPSIPWKTLHHQSPGSNTVTGTMAAGNDNPLIARPKDAIIGQWIPLIKRNLMLSLRPVPMRISRRNTGHG